MPTRSPAHGPLTGWRVLELADGTAAMFCGRLLADLGAEVVMVEPTDGHPRRADEPRRPDGFSARFAYVAAGKRSVVDGDVGALAAAADLVVTDREPAWIATRVDRSVPVVSVRPFGASGPGAGRRAHHLTVFHASGEGSTLPSGRSWELFPDRAPIQLGSEIGYFDAGWNAAVAAVAVLYDALRSTAAPTVDVSVQESLLTLSRSRMNRWNNEGVCVGRERNRYGITGMLQCRDGWVQVVGLRSEHWDRLIAGPDAEEFREFDSPAARDADVPGLGRVLAAWCGRRPKAYVAEVMARVGAPAGIFADAADLVVSEQLAHRAFFEQIPDGCGSTLRLPGAPYRLSRTPAGAGPTPEIGSAVGFEPRPAPPRTDGLGPGRFLDGVRVLDFTWAAAGPYATLLLGFLGAEVIKVESTRRIDPARSGFLARYEGTDHSPIFNELNLNKRSLQLDLTRPEGLGIARRLAAEADVVVENFRPGVLARLGLGVDELSAANPRLVIASSSANGSTGPDAKAAGLASIFAATGGLSVQTGYADGPPTEVGDPVDYRSGAALAVAVLAALVHQARSGEGQYVDLSSREVVIASSPDAVLAHEVGASRPPRLGNGHEEFAPHDVYACADDGWLALAVGTDDEWLALCDVLERPDWVERFSSAQARRLGTTEIDAAIAAWAKPRSAREAAAVLQQAGVPANMVLTFADLATDEHLAARGVFVEIDHPELGRQRVMRAPWLFSTDLADVRRPGPLLGADNAAVLSRFSDLPPIPAEVFT